MGDVSMNIFHVILSNDFENGGKECLVEGYLSVLEDATNHKVGTRMMVESGRIREMWQCDTISSCVDYLRL